MFNTNNNEITNHLDTHTRNADDVDQDDTNEVPILEGFDAGRKLEFKKLLSLSHIPE
ncbi:unnamed protein product [Sphenostylis stenocarpa]|uniref:Uncharacterized protein n=1 Tax=Sphenostylis stenocarpa TaxID=92480 RepID=A0AA86V355_9FABA|nr:unnamed protein product [Sphenostylis stenocarpa]